MANTQPKAEYSADKAGKTKDAAGGQTTEGRRPVSGVPRVFGSSAFTAAFDVFSARRRERRRPSHSRQPPPPPTTMLRLRTVPSGRIARSAPLYSGFAMRGFATSMARYRESHRPRRRPKLPA